MPGPPRPPDPPHQQPAAPLPPQQMRSYGQDAAAAAVVTSAPIHPHGHDLAATSLMDEDEDIPTVVAQPRGGEPLSRGPRPAAGAGAWNGHSTQLMAEGSGGAMGGGFDSTIALPDSDAAMGIQHNVEELDRHEPRPPQHAQPPHHAHAPHHAQGQGGGYDNAVEYQQLPGGPPGGHYHQALSANQAAIETKMSLPRPAAVAQWLMEQGDVEIGGPRSTGVIIAIAALATLCVMGVASLIVYKLRLPTLPEPATAVSTASPLEESVLPASEEELAEAVDEAPEQKKKRPLATRVTTSAPARARAAG